MCTHPARDTFTVRAGPVRPSRSLRSAGLSQFVHSSVTCRRGQLRALTPLSRHRSPSPAVLLRRSRPISSPCVVTTRLRNRRPGTSGRHTASPNEVPCGRFSTGQMPSAAGCPSLLVITAWAGSVRALPLASPAASLCRVHTSRTSPGGPVHRAINHRPPWFTVRPGPSHSSPASPSPQRAALRCGTLS